MRTDEHARRESEGKKQHSDEHLPEDVLNKVQDPESMKDPLVQELEKSKEQNAPEQNRTLQEVKKREESNQG